VYAHALYVIQAGGPQEPNLTKVNSVRTHHSTNNDSKKSKESKEEIKPNGSG